jgi:hypothetical protein
MLNLQQRVCLAIHWQTYMENIVQKQQTLPVKIVARNIMLASKQDS